MDELIEKLNNLSISFPNKKNDIDILCSELNNIDINCNMNEMNPKFSISETNPKFSISEMNPKFSISETICRLSQLAIINDPDVLSYINEYFTFLYKKNRCVSESNFCNSLPYIF